MGTKQLKKAGKKGDLNDTVYNALKELILSGRLRPGVRLVHQDLANQLSVSRTPVRESLERLYQEGYAGRRPRRGYVVAEIQTSDVRDLYGTREALELFAYQSVADRKFSPAEIEELDQLNARYAKMFPDSINRVRLQTDRAFHLKLASLSGNQFLFKTLESVLEKIELKRRLDGPGLAVDDLPLREHNALLAAIRAGELAEGREILRNHIRHACDRFLQHLEANRGFGEVLSSGEGPQPA